LTVFQAGLASSTATVDEPQEQIDSPGVPMPAPTADVSSYGSRAMRVSSHNELRSDVALSTRQSLDALPNMVWVYDRHLALSFVNLVGRKLLGLSAGELAGRRDEDLFVSKTTNAYLPTLHFATASKQRAVSGPVLLQPRTADAQAVACVLTFAPVLDEHNQVACLVASAHELASETLDTEQLQVAVAGFAHDINNLLMVIGNYQSFVAGGPLSAQQSSDLKIAAAATHSGGALAARLMHLSKGQQTISPAVDVNEIVASATLMLGPLLGDGIQLSAELADLPLPVLAGADEIEQVIINLALNARDAMHSGPLAIRVRSALVLGGNPLESQLAPGQYAVISVKDAGPGIDPQTLARIFDPFFTTKALCGGTGLGLFMVKDVVARLGGAVRVETTVGQGSEFLVYLPSSQAAPPPSSSALTDPLTV
jgi:signal transduction histidine kinase